MSPSKPSEPPSSATVKASARVALAAGLTLHDERLRRRWTLRKLAKQAELSLGAVHGVEAGRAASLETYVRLAGALGLKVEVTFSDPRRTAVRIRPEADLVHAAMGELEAVRFGSHRFQVGIDEPYQNYRFGGRADVLAWDLARRALLHVENRTRFPDLQDAAGSWNAKRTYLPDAVADRLGVRGRWRSVTHAMVVLWSGEVLHTLRLRTATFRALCPDPHQSFADWWSGSPPAAGVTSMLVVLDPLARGRQRLYIGLDDALRAEPRHRGYAEVARQLERRARSG